MSDSYNPFYVSSDTELEEVLDHVRECVESPEVIEDDGENVVWNFSSYEIERDKMKLGYRNHDEFVIPYQVRSVWAFMYTLLPERLKNAEVLIYRPDDGRYIAYQQFYRQMSPEQREQLQYSLSQRIEEVVEE